MPRLVADQLSSAFVNNAKRGKAAPGMYADGGGLYLYVGAPNEKTRERDPKARGAVSWLFRYMRDRHPHEMGLGPLRDIGLAEARERAAERRRELLDDKDPMELHSRQAKRERRERERQEAQARAMTFQNCAELYIAANRAAWKNPVHAAQWPSTLKTYCYPVFGALPVQAIDAGLVLQVLEPIWTAKAETASRVRGRIETVLDYARARDWRQGENPARWRGHLDKLLPAPSKAKGAVRRSTGRNEHHAALPYGEIAGFIAELRQQKGTAARALEFAILTAARTGEVVGARRQEFDLAEKLWTIPAERMKAGKEHRVPLSDRALAIVAELAQGRPGDRGSAAAAAGAGFVFPGGIAGKPLSNMAMLTLLRRMQRDDVTTHGFRSTFRDWAAERTSFTAEVAEMALAHAVGDKVEAAYRRGDLFGKRRQIMDAWAKFCASPALAAGAVVPLRRA
jgi:integrase